MFAFHCHGRRRGFTLVELLVVIGIIAVLIAILLPALAGARRQAQLTACLANQRSIAQAAAAYQAQYDGWLPRDAFSGINCAFYAPWMAKTLKYSVPEEKQDQNGKSYPRVHVDSDYCVKWLGTMKLFQCPALGDDDNALDYAINSLNFQRYVAMKKWDEYWWQKSTYVKSPSTVVYTVEANITTLGVNAIGKYSVYRAEHMPFKDGQPNSDSRMIAPDDKRHGGWTTMSFFDGHAEIRELTPEALPITLINAWATQ